jgi:beta-glucanase (GH16 family)
VAGGSLHLTAHRELVPFWCQGGVTNAVSSYSSGMVTSMGRFSQTYGRFEVRAKLPSATVKGLQTSLWLWPVNSARYGPWPASGEIDFAEWFSEHPDRVIPFIHYRGDHLDPSATNNNCIVNDVDEFHTYAVEWTSSSIKVLYDGQVCIDDQWTPTPPQVRPQPFDQPFFVSLTQAVGLGSNAPDWATPFPASTQIDYVRVWQ